MIHRDLQKTTPRGDSKGIRQFCHLHPESSGKLVRMGIWPNPKASRVRVEDRTYTSTLRARNHSPAVPFRECTFPNYFTLFILVLLLLHKVVPQLHDVLLFSYSIITFRKYSLTFLFSFHFAPKLYIV